MSTPTTPEHIKALRLSIDGVARSLEYISKRTPNVWEPLGKSAQSVFLAKAWLGKILGYLGTETPYKNEGNRKSVQDIEPTDSVSEPHPLPTDATIIEGIDFIRGVIGKLIKVLEEEIIFLPGAGPGRELAIARTNAYTHLCEARFHLGFALEAIRNAD